MTLAALIKSAAKFLRAHCINEQEIRMSDEIEQLEMFKTFYPRICSKAEYCIKEK